MKYLLIILLSLNGQRIEVPFDSMKACRTAAHSAVGDPRPINAVIHEFRSRSGSATAYCVSAKS